MSKFVASVAGFDFRTNKLHLDSFVTAIDDWKLAVLHHPEFLPEKGKENNLDWLNHDFEVAKKQLDNNDLAIEVQFVKISE